MRRTMVLAIFAAFAASCSRPAAPAFPAGELVDLSHPYDEQTIFWPTAERFLTVPDPRLAVLRDTPRLFRAIQIRLTEPS